jgi:hypothetical protein
VSGHLQSGDDPSGLSRDVVVENTIFLEIKAVAPFLPAHYSQLLTYLRMSYLRIGLLMNFHAARLKDGPRRFIVLTSTQRLRGIPWSSRVLRGETNQPRRPHDPGSDPTT